jgi:hypothetical protein
LELARSERMDVRFIGVLKSLALIGLALAFTFALAERPLWMVANAAVFGIVLADPVVTLWMNTLYTEFSAVLFCYAAIGCLVVIAGIAPDRIGWYLWLAAALVGLGLSRQQHAFLPICLAILVLPVAWRYRRALGTVVLMLAITVAIIQTVVIQRAPTLRAANSVDVVLGTLLPASRAPERALATLQLPERCEALIGATWYVTMGESVAARCPEAQRVPAGRLVALLASEPSIAIRALARATPMAQSVSLRYLGVEESRRFGMLDTQPSPLARSLATPIENMPLIAQAGWLLCLFLVVVIAAIAWVVDGVRWGTSIGPLITAALAGTASYALLTSVFGDGMVEVTRHVHLATVASLALIIVAMVASILGAWGRRSRAIVAGAIVGRPTSLIFTLSIIGAVLAVAMSSVIWVPAFRQQPLAIGAIDEPASNRLASSRALLHGWVLDPFSPARAHAIINETTRVEPRPWRHPTDPTGLELERVYPNYFDRAAARFEIPIDIAAFGGRPVRVKTYAVNVEGITTEIDRRTLVPPSR